MGLTKVELKGLDDGTDGQIITYDANGNPVAVGPGTDGIAIKNLSSSHFE